MKRRWLAVFLLSSVAQAAEILVIGDSHSCGAFGKRLFENLVSGGDRVTLYCTPSSSPTHWLDGRNPSGHKCQVRSSDASELADCGGNGATPSLRTLLARHAGARVIVALGTNSLHSSSAGDTYAEMAAQIQSAGRACDWIGPPHLNPAEAPSSSRERIRQFESNLNGFYASLASVSSPACALVDSRPATERGTPGYSTSDGVHRGRIAGGAWADRVTPKHAASAENGPGFVISPGESAR